MPKKKGFDAGRYQKEILEALNGEPFMSTSEICHKLSMGYNTGCKYIEMLHASQKINLKKTGNRRFWFVG